MAETSKIRVFLAEDHELVRSGLRLLIDAQPDLTVVGEASDGVSALELITEQKPDVVIVDLSMPRMNGIELTSRLKMLRPPPRVLTLTANEDAAYIREMFQVGASGYLQKRSAANELIHAIRTVARGERFVASNLIGEVVDQLTASSPRPAIADGEALSDREAEVLRMIAEGLTNREVGERLEISIKSVETYKSRGMQKAKLRGRADIVRYAASQGWLRFS
jgi:DNA-binding NarL/FixJ family response regulator